MRRDLRRNIVKAGLAVAMALAVVIIYSFLTRPMKPAPGGAIDAKLERHITLVRPKQLEIADALRAIGERAGLRIAMDLDPVTLRARPYAFIVRLELEDLPVRAALDKVVRQLGIGAHWRIEEDGINVVPAPNPVVTVPVGSRTAAMAAAKKENAERVLRIYNVQHLLDEHVRWRKKNPEPGVTATAATIEAEARDRLWRLASSETITPGNNTILVNATGIFVGPVAPGLAAPVSMWGGFMVVRHNAEGHRRIEDLLAVLRQR